MNKKLFIDTEYDASGKVCTVNELMNMIFAEIYPHQKDKFRGLFAWRTEEGAQDAFNLNFLSLNYFSELERKSEELTSFLSGQETAG